MQLIMENYDLVVYNVPKNPNPLTAQHNILTTYSEMTKVHLNQIWEKLKVPDLEKSYTN